MKNSEVVEIYLRLYRDQERLLQTLFEEGVGDQKSLLSAVKTWIRSFRYRWRLSHGKAKFYEKFKDWLDETFMVTFKISPLSFPL